MFEGPVETLTVTVLFLATLLPLSGFVLITTPDFTELLGVLFSSGTRPAALICALAAVQDSPFTRGTFAEAPPPPCNRMAATTAAAITTIPAMPQGSQRRPPPPCWPAPPS